MLRCDSRGPPHDKDSLQGMRRMGVVVEDVNLATGSVQEETSIATEFSMDTFSAFGPVLQHVDGPAHNRRMGMMADDSTQFRDLSYVENDSTSASMTSFNLSSSPVLPAADSPMKLTFCTSNRAKFDFMQAVLEPVIESGALVLEQHPLEGLPELQCDAVREVA